jgi:hypothetical protein
MLTPFLASRSLCSGDTVKGDVSPLGLDYVGSFTSLQEPPQWGHVVEVSLPWDLIMLAPLLPSRSLSNGDILRGVSLPWDLVMLSPLLACMSLHCGDMLWEVSPLGPQHVGYFSCLLEPLQWQHTAAGVSLP